MTEAIWADFITSSHSMHHGSEEGDKLRSHFPAIFYICSYVCKWRFLPGSLLRPPIFLVGVMESNQTKF